jgi:hypothetical protein
MLMSCQQNSGTSHNIKKVNKAFENVVRLKLRGNDIDKSKFGS